MQEFIDSPEFGESVREFFGNIEKENSERKRFFESVAFTEKCNEIEALMREKGVSQVDSEDFNYKSLDWIAKDDFFLVTAATFQESECYEDDGVAFSNQNVVIGNLHFFQMYGQGTFTAIRLIEK